MRKGQILLAPLVLLMIVFPTMAQQLIGPDPTRQPRDVIAIQLSALQLNDFPSPDAGISGPGNPCIM